jgi:hypothetical protein
LPEDSFPCFYCRNNNHSVEIYTYYNAIISALHESANMRIPRTPLHSFKPFWNDELEQMKSDCIFGHNLWVDGGRAFNGYV